MNIAIIGTGYVGLVTGACFADLGNKVYCVDSDQSKINFLKKSCVTIYEPGLEEMVKRNIKKKRISFSTDIKNCVNKCEIIFICVGTPSKENGEPDLVDLENVSRKIAKSMNSYKLIVEKSTVPVETGEWVEKTIAASKKRNVNFDMASNPEFLREGTAINDFMHPDRIVIGTKSEKAKRMLIDLYKPLKSAVVATDIKSAEIIKHASNSYLAMKISFINAISIICEKSGADIKEVAKGIGLDGRIGKDFLKAGAGFGGSCFPKDLSAFIHIAEKLGYNFTLLKEVHRINESQKDLIIGKISKVVWNIPGKTIGVLGLSFKPDTDDIRNAPALDIIKELIKHGAKIRVYDPKAMAKTKKILKKDVTYCDTAYLAAKGSDALLVMTEWDEFKKLDFKKIKKLLTQPVIIDGRNIYEPAAMKKLGFIYTGIGRRMP
ncbi:MAG: UDP-glucose/GDP-mannose dehydrogenase family protein [Candidatus Omnitrophica bacterium]|nr:UDP-glucose/GDP-mannose dehydrogenase family protein [Candidatus Omnitrophota bacterium]